MRFASSKRWFEPFKENRQSFILLRWLVIILASYLILVPDLLALDQEGQDLQIVALILGAFFASNLILVFLPMRAFVFLQSNYVIVLADACFVSACLYLLRVPGLMIHIPLIAIFLMAVIWSDVRILLFSLFVVSVLFWAFSGFNLFGFGDQVALDQFLATALLFVVSIVYAFLSNSLGRDTATSTSMLEEQKNSQLMVEITRSLSTLMNAEEIYTAIVTRLRDAMGSGEFSIVRVSGDHAAVLATSSSSQTAMEPIALKDAPVLESALEETRIVSSSERGVKRGRTNSIAIPMVTQGEFVGCIYYEGQGIQVPPSDLNVHLFEVVATTAANALRNVQLFEEMKHMARTDFLTGLPNHRYFQSALSREMGRAGRHSHPLSLLIIDLDRLKAINDRFGHPEGDTVIRSVASTIRSTCREIDFAARYGGEEYVVILPETDLMGAIEVAERLRRRIEETDTGSEARVTASIGIANYPINAGSKDDLIRVADQALYVAKNGGRNRVAHIEHQLTG